MAGNHSDPNREDYTGRSAFLWIVLAVLTGAALLSMDAVLHSQKYVTVEHDIHQVRTVSWVFIAFISPFILGIVNAMRENKANYKRTLKRSQPAPSAAPSWIPTAGIQESLIRSNPVPKRTNGDVLPGEQKWIAAHQMTAQEIERARTAQFESQRAIREVRRQAWKAKKAERSAQAMEAFDKRLSEMSEK